MSLDVRARLSLTNLLTTRRVEAAISRGIEKGFFFDVLPLAVELSPFRRGTNRRSIIFTVSGTEAEIHTESGYGGYLEIGTPGRPARPYLRPAVERSVEKIAERIRREL